LVVTKTRSLDEWAAHPQGRAVAALPWLEIVKVADSPPRRLPAADRPLAGVRVLELTRIIAGPVAGRTLAAHGADVLHISSPNLPSIPSLVVDTGRGKRPAFLDLDTPAGRDTLAGLAASADVFIQGYRPGGLAARGADPLDLAHQNPGLIAVSLSAFGHVGPWSNRRGFDSLTQNANGINVAEARAASVYARSGLPAAEPGSRRAGSEGANIDSPAGALRPKELPAQALDHGAGYLLAFGAMIALHRRATEGGSWLVRSSLAQVGEWLKSLGRLDAGHQATDPKLDDIADLIETSDSGFGPLRAVRHAALLSKTPARWALPAMRLGHYAPQWSAP
jgi:crotonobetainyl-CoA:carnitine CoA-transferase CaiB-like acyl-CoA transferase